MTNGNYRRVVMVGLVVMGLPVLFSLVDYARGAEGEPFLAPAKPDTACILESAAMRYTHMTFLKDLRDRVVREENRSAEGDLDARGMNSCRGCHPDRAAFCDRCHDRASVRLDCFDCHKY
ncbi:MAG: hypothetical protein JW751_02385 [Polyangiaceae bacterium]|nr:hypothetical protein [Polyangiaceae bacterium]